MKILCVSDTVSSLAFSSAVRDIYPNVDLVLSCGDMPLESHDWLSTMTKSDVYYVFGNHQLKHFNELMDKSSSPFDTADKEFLGFLCDGKCLRTENGLLIAGLGGSMLYNGGQSQYSEKEMERRIRKLVPALLYNKTRYGRYLDILLTHAPAFGYGDGKDLCHMGFKCFLPFLDKFAPKYLVHGHCHLIDRNAQREFKYKKTTIINAYGSVLIEDSFGV